MEAQAVTTSFLAQGVLGALCLVLLYGITKIYLELRSARKECAGEIAKLTLHYETLLKEERDEGAKERKMHSEELSKLQERSMVKAETYATKAQEVVEACNRVMDSLQRKLVRGG